MSGSIELSDGEELPLVQFFLGHDVLVLSSDSEGEGVSGGPKERGPQPRTFGRATSSISPPRSTAAPFTLAPKARPPGPSTRAQPGAPQAKRGRKNPESVTALIDSGLLQDGCGGQVLTALQTQDIPCVIQTQAVPRSITWNRTSGNTTADGLCQEEADILIVVPGEEFVAMVQNWKKESLGSTSTETLTSLVARAKAGKEWKVPTLVVMEMEKFFSGGKKLSRRKWKETTGSDVLGNGKKKQGKRKVQETLTTLSRVEMEEVLMDFQLHTDVKVWFLETWKELADFVCMFSKAVADAPTKRQRDNTSFSFYLDGEWAGGVRVERCGKGLLEVWRRQLQQFNRISVEIANAVVAAYPSPQLLVKAYCCCRTEEERQNLLSDILVRRGEGVTSTSRRIGPEISKRIYLQMMSREAELSLDLT